MSDIDGALKMNIRYGSSMSYEKEKFSYSGGVCVKDLLHRPSVHNQILLLLKKVKAIVKMRERR
ncbi:hypothetical protein Bca52824_050566 [Brassica carinata]|uniref:Uncharacterized protein n=1 Tax=Brassica carinata TaxID=52824 RepID=A0A8X7UIZ6_BRACI|nr:hypothetical protein Bca52824_050566 [Brassica carinata]